MRNSIQCPDMPVNYKIITIISVALCIQTISFFVYLYLQAKLYKWLIVFIPFISGTCIYKIFLNESWTWSLVWTLSATIFYQRCYILVMRNMPKSFTYGEASILVQGVLLFAINCVLVLEGKLCNSAVQLFGDLSNLNIIMMVIFFKLVSINNIINIFIVTFLLLVCFTMAFDSLYFISSFQNFTKTYIILSFNGNICFGCYISTCYTTFANSFCI